MNMRKIIGKLFGLYHTYRMLAWLSWLIGCVAVPLLGYGMSALSTLRDRRVLSEGDPEDAHGITVPDPWQWLTGSGGAIGRIMLVLMIAGLALLVLLLVAQIASPHNAGKRGGHDGTEASVIERGEAQASVEDSYGDGYGDDDDGDGWGDEPSPQESIEDGFGSLPERGGWSRDADMTGEV
jgi:hypothetical protein